MKKYAIPLLLFLAGTTQAQQHVEVPRADGAKSPMIVYEPATTKGCAPLVLLSHGAGGSEERGLRYLGKTLARDGWRAIALGHRESGMPVLRKDMRAEGFHNGIAALVTDADAYKARFMDIDAALKWSEAQCHAPYKVLAGHSMGAITVVLEAGARNKLGLSPHGAFDAYVALSPEGPGIVFPNDAWQPIKAPMLLITGTKDKGLDGDWTWRAQAFDGLGRGACRWLAVFDGATHMNFGGLDFGDRYKTRVASLVTQYLGGLRGGRCPDLAATAGITLRSK